MEEKHIHVETVETRKNVCTDCGCSKTASVLAWFAFIMAGVALIIGWQAYNRTGVDLEDKIEQAIVNALDNTGEALQDSAQVIENN